MMKSAIMKDLYGEIERLKQGIYIGHIFVILLSYSDTYSESRLVYVSSLDCSEVYAAREKNGIYIPKERYTQEEAEKKVQFLLRNISGIVILVFDKMDLDFILYMLLQAMAEKIELMEVESEAKDKVRSSIRKIYSAVSSFQSY